MTSIAINSLLCDLTSTTLYVWIFFFFFFSFFLFYNNNLLIYVSKRAIIVLLFSNRNLVIWLVRFVGTFVSGNLCVSL